MESLLNRIGFVKGTTTTGRFHEDEVVQALLGTGRRYYKDPLIAYEEHPWVYSAVWAVANAAAMLTPKMFKMDDKNQVIEVPKHWLLDLLEHPNNYYSGYDLLEGTFSYLELLGNSFWEVVRNGSKIKEFYLMRADRVQVVGDEKTMVKGYIYTPNMREFRLNPEQVLHFKNFSPTSEIHGQGSIRASKGALEADFLGDEYFKDFFRRGAELSFAVKVPTTLSDTSYGRLTTALKSKHQGTGKHKGILILEEGADYVKTGAPPKETGEEESAVRARKAIASGVGVPPIKLQLLEGATYANARFQDIGFWRGTMMPRLKKFYAKITLECLRKEGSTEWITPNLFKELMNIDEFRNEATAYKTLVDTGILTRNEARDRLGFGSKPEGDKLMTNPNTVSLDDLASAEGEEFEDES